jgi:hypothetical protein
MMSDLDPIVSALEGMQRALSFEPVLRAWLPDALQGLRLTFWQYLALVSAPPLGFLTLDWLTKPRRRR